MQTVVGGEHQLLTGGHTQRGVERQVETAHAHFAQVHRAPHKEVIGYAHNALLHLIVVSIGCEQHLPRSVSGLRSQPQVGLARQLGFQVGTAQMMIVVFGKRGHSERLFVASTQNTRKCR